MATNVIMPALGMAQEKGRLIRWLVEPGATVNKGDPLMEVETDKATVEIEAPASGILANVTAAAGDEIPVTRVIAAILEAGESAKGTAAAPQPPPAASAVSPPAASLLAAKMAAEHDIDLRLVVPKGMRVEKDDVLAYIEAQKKAAASATPQRILASPKARRLAAEQGVSLASVPGTGPEGAILAGDVLAAAPKTIPGPIAVAEPVATPEPVLPPSAPTSPVLTETVSTLWRVMAERMTQCWTTVPHFYLLREANAEGLIAWRNKLLQRSTERSSFQAKITFTDLLTKVVAGALAKHPRLNASWRDGVIALNNEINVGLAVAVEGGLVVPVIHHADRLGVGEIAHRRQELMARAQAGKLRPEDLTGGTFTISNLGMYGVDAFNAIVNPPQAAILAVGRIADRVVAVNGQPAVRPTLMLSLSCDHRVVDGARGAAFLDTLAELIEEPLALLG
jgi:pyruvate dehydrogenase E2 component (dihydrolipoamide acetyltransferase)